MFLLPKRPLIHCRIPGSLLNEESVLVADAHHCDSLNLVLGCPHGTEARGGHAPSRQPHGPLPRDPCSCRPSSAGNLGRPAWQDMHGYDKDTHKAKQEYRSLQREERVLFFCTVQLCPLLTVFLSRTKV